jgi:hypothetical protein
MLYRLLPIYPYCGSAPFATEIFCGSEAKKDFANICHSNACTSGLSLPILHSIGPPLVAVNNLRISSCTGKPVRKYVRQ